MAPIDKNTIFYVEHIGINYIIDIINPDIKYALLSLRTQTLISDIVLNVYLASKIPNWDFVLKLL